MGMGRDNRLPEHFHSSHPHCSFWETMNWWREQFYVKPHFLVCFCSYLYYCKDGRWYSDNVSIPHFHGARGPQFFVSSTILCKIDQVSIFSLSLSLHWSVTPPSLCATSRFLAWKVIRNGKNWVIKKALDKPSNSVSFLS